MDTYERQLEQMRQALANAWEAGYAQAYEDRVDNEFTPNPYVLKEMI